MEMELVIYSECNLGVRLSSCFESQQSGFLTSLPVQ